MLAVTWVRAIGITLLLLLAMAFTVAPFLIRFMEDLGTALPGITVTGIYTTKAIRNYWYVFLLLGLVLTLIPTKSIEPARVRFIEPFLWIIIVGIVLLFVGVFCLPLIEVFAATPQLKKK
jgi:hypothetical protein